MTFHAIDRETGLPVALRRVFPYGADGGGFQKDERHTFEDSLQRLAGEAAHPALRAVIGGGCDPVDGVPFIVTEWVEGTILKEKLAAGPLPAKQATAILLRALELSSILSDLFGEQAVWVDTDAAAIIEADPATGRGTTFWISPFKWLGADDERRSLKPIVQLTEDLMGWKNKLVNDQAGSGLAVWLKWLKQHARTATLAEARDGLATATGTALPGVAKAVPQPARPSSRATTRPGVKSASPTKPSPTRAATAQPTAQATTSTKTKPGKAGKAKKSSPLPAILAVVGILIVAALGALVVFKDRVPFMAGVLPEKGLLPAREAPKSAMEIALAGAENPSSPEAPAPAPAAASSDPAAASSTSSTSLPDGVYDVSEGSRLLKFNNKTISVEGELEIVKVNQEKTQIFLEFKKTDPTFACGWLLKKDAKDGLSEEALEALKGRKIRITGKVGLGSAGEGRGKRAKVQITSASDITPL